MSLDSVVVVNINLQTSPLEKAGFGTAMIAGYTDAIAERVKTYTAATGIADMQSDGFAADSPHVRAAQSLLAQAPNVVQYKVGRFALVPTMSHLITVDAGFIGVTYTVEINGEAFSFTAVTADPIDIAAGLDAAINAGSEPVTSDDSAADGTFTLTADVAGDLYTLLIFTDNEPEATMSQLNTTADPGIATDLAAVLAADDDWYGLTLTSESPDEIEAAAGWVSTLDKIFVSQSADGSVQDAPDTVPPSVDIGDVLFSNSYANSSLWAHREEGAYMGAGVLGRILPTDPGSATVNGKRLSGITTSSWSTTEIANMDAKKVNHYDRLGGVGFLREGTMASGQFIDTIRGSHWLKARLQERVFALIATLQKIPYTDAGIGLVVAEVRAQANEGITQGYLSPDPYDEDNDILDPFILTFPRASDVSDNDKANRILPDIVLQAKLAGAIHKVIPITVTLSL